LGGQHSSTATSYYNIGNAYYSLMEYSKALGYHEKSLKIKIATLGEHHSSVAFSYYNIYLI